MLGFCPPSKTLRTSTKTSARDQHGSLEFLFVCLRGRVGSISAVNVTIIVCSAFDETEKRRDSENTNEF